MDSSRNGKLRSGELARLAGVSADTLRHYERKGLISLPHRSSNGYREYAPETLERVRLVRRALRIGFTLDELSHIFKVRDRGGIPCREVRSLARSKLLEVEERLREISEVRDELRALLEDWEERLFHTPAGTRAGLLESLASDQGRSGSENLPLARRGLNRKRGR